MTLSSPSPSSSSPSASKSPPSVMLLGTPSAADPMLSSSEIWIRFFLLAFFGPPAADAPGPVAEVAEAGPLAGRPRLVPAPPPVELPRPDRLVPDPDAPKPADADPPAPVGVCAPGGKWAADVEGRMSVCGPAPEAEKDVDKRLGRCGRDALLPPAPPPPASCPIFEYAF